METKELIEKLIAHYEQAIENVKAARDWNSILYKLSVAGGVCNCAKRVFGEYSPYTLPDWILRYTVDGLYWGEYPVLAKTKKQAVERLNIRLTNLKTELKRIS